MNKNTKLFIFDFDGTLADTVPHIINCTLKCIEKFNLKKLTKEDILRFNGAVLADVMKMLGATDDDLPKIKKYYADSFLEDMSDIYLYDGVEETLLKLKEKGYILTLASNRGRNTVEPLLKYLGIENLFEKVVCESDVENKKPNPDMVEYLLKETGHNKNEAIVIGDTKFDVLMGKTAGCKTCLVSYTKNVDDSILELNPDFIIYNFKKIIKLVL